VEIFDYAILISMIEFNKLKYLAWHCKRQCRRQILLSVSSRVKIRDYIFGLIQCVTNNSNANAEQLILHTRETSIVLLALVHPILETRFLLVTSVISKFLPTNFQQNYQLGFVMYNISMDNQLKEICALCIYLSDIY